MKHNWNNKTRKIKAFFSVILSAVMLLSLSSVCFAAMAGDVDGNGAVSAADSRFVFRASVGLEDLSAEQKTAADVIKESATEAIINVMDAREILRMSVGLAMSESKLVTFTDMTDSYDGKIKLFCEENENGIRLYVMADKVSELNAFELNIGYDESKLIFENEKYPTNKGDFKKNYNYIQNASTGNIAFCGYFNEYFSYDEDNENYFDNDFNRKDAYTLQCFDFNYSEKGKSSCEFSVTGKMYVKETAYSSVNETYTFIPEEEETTQPETPTVHEHSFSREVIIEPGCDTIGEMEFTCSCGEVYRGIIPATGHTDENADNICDVCDKDITEKDNSSDNTSDDSSDFLAKILSILKKIAEFFKKLFNM